MKFTRKTILFVIMILGFTAFAWGCGDNGGAVEPAAEEPADLASISGLDQFLGGWGYIDGTELNIVTLFEEDGKLRADFAAITGGGYYATFDPADITVDGDTLICTNGSVMTDWGEAKDGTFIGRPASSEKGGYRFVLDSEVLTPVDEQSYGKVADTQEEMDRWIEENHTPL